MQGWLQRFKLLRPNKRKFIILDQLNGRITPGRMTLLLGPPGSGKSTLLAALAGKLRHSELQASPLCTLLDLVMLSGCLRDRLLYICLYMYRCIRQLY